MNIYREDYMIRPMLKPFKIKESAKWLWRVWYLPTKRSRKPLFIDVLATHKNAAWIEAEKTLTPFAVFLNAFEVPDDDSI